METVRIRDGKKSDPGSTSRIRNTSYYYALPPGDGAVGEPGNVRLALLHDGHGEHGQVTVNNASAHRLKKEK